MVWGCLGGTKTGDLHQICGIMDQLKYHAILVRHAMPALKRPFLYLSDVTLRMTTIRNTLLCDKHVICKVVVKPQARKFVIGLPKAST